MNNEKLIAWGKGSLALSLLLSMAYVSPAFAFSGGVTSSSDCTTSCHTGGTASIAIIGDSEVVPGSTGNEYTLTILDGPLDLGGLNVWVDDGVLGLITGGTRLDSGEITHSSPQAGNGTDPISWTFSWDAPSVDGVYDLMARAVSAASGGGAGNDSAGMTSFAVTVAAIPIPAAVYLFGSALGLLGWMRRRAA